MPIRPISRNVKVTRLSNRNIARFTISSIRPSKAKDLAERWVINNFNIDRDDIEGKVTQGIIRQRVVVSWER